MLPQTTASRPAARRISPSSVTTVDFPLLPVTATVAPEQYQLPSSSSLTTGIAASRAQRTGAEDGCTPGLTATSREPTIKRRVCPPSSTSAPARVSSSAKIRCSGEAACSVTRTMQPSWSSHRAAASPLRASPTTVTGVPGPGRWISGMGRSMGRSPLVLIAASMCSDSRGPGSPPRSRNGPSPWIPPIRPTGSDGAAGPSGRPSSPSAGRKRPAG